MKSNDADECVLQRSMGRRSNGGFSLLLIGWIWRNVGILIYLRNAGHNLQIVSEYSWWP